MTDVPSHLFQPLSVDTNITYDLDMTLFPGLEDPQHMYQPALFIATDWSQYVADVVIEKDVDADVPQEDDLFSLLESSEGLIDLDTTSSNESEAFQSFIDDVILETDTDLDESYVLDTNTEDSHTLDVDIAVSGNLLETSSLGGQKRKRTSDEDYSVVKKSRSDSLSLQIPSLVSVCPTSNSYGVNRDS